MKSSGHANFTGMGIVGGADFSEMKLKEHADFLITKVGGKFDCSGFEIAKRVNFNRSTSINILDAFAEKEATAKSLYFGKKKFELRDLKTYLDGVRASA